MLHTCPRCGDYYADDSLAFCLADGTPLVGVDPLSQRWSEGARLVEEKERAQRKWRRRLKWRRVLAVTTTMLITTMVVFVVAANSLIYLRPNPDTGSGVVATALTPAPATPPETPTPTPTATPTPTPTPHCSEADERREKEILISKYEKTWGRIIKREEPDIAARYGKYVLPVSTPRNALVANREPEVLEGVPKLDPVNYKVAFSKACTRAFVTARYAWRIVWADRGNGLPKIEDRKIPKRKPFTCLKDGGNWRCG